jgi:hypothetical protein
MSCKLQLIIDFSIPSQQKQHRKKNENDKNNNIITENSSIDDNNSSSSRCSSKTEDANAQNDENLVREKPYVVRHSDIMGR